MAISCNGLTYEQANRIIMLHNDGLSRRKIAEIMKVSRETVTKYVDNPEIVEGLATGEEKYNRCPYCGRMVKLPCLACHLEREDI